MEYISIEAMSRERLDEYLCLHAAKIVRWVWVDMPDDVAVDFFYLDEERGVYRYGLIDAVFNCLSYLLANPVFGDDVEQAMREMITPEVYGDLTANKVIDELRQFSCLVSEGKLVRLDNMVG